MIKYCCVLIILLTLFYCCNFSGFVYKKQIIDKYYLIAIDIDEQMTICYPINNGDFIGIIDETVYSIGYNKDFIIAKQHPFKLPNNYEKSKTNYFIIPISKKRSIIPEDNVIGPLTKAEFETNRKNLNIPDSLSFTIIFENLK